jgi:hypothetical protein
MNITGDYKDSRFILINNGRVIAEYMTWSEYRDAWDRLARLQAQIDHPEFFCDCCAVEPGGRR